MRRLRSASLGAYAIALLMVGFACLGTVAVAGSFATHSTGATAATNLDAVLYRGSFSNPQPSPYCLVFGGTVPVMCYTPQDLKAAYNYPSNLNGAGQTIVIVDAFGSPTVQSDLNTFDTLFNLPPTTLQIVCQGGTCPVFNSSNPDEVGWSQEIALDTQYAHAMAPAAHIVLYVGLSDDDLVLEQAVASAIQMFPHSIISQSWGDPEPDLLTAPTSYIQQVLQTGEAAYQQAAREGTTVFASAGDYGASNYVYDYTTPNPEWPSDSPWVTSVGGTEGNPYYFDAIPNCDNARVCSTGLVTFLNNPACELNTLAPTTTPECTPVGYGGEQVWNEGDIDGLGTGGAPSAIFSVPFYQHGLGLSGRGVPDVSYSAPLSGGVFGYWSAVPSAAGLYIFSGTSCGSPQWAAITALADQLSTNFHLGTLGFINPTLYFIGHNPFLYREAFHDITVGNNAVGGTPGFDATRGWDEASGWGTPDVSNLIQDLVLLG
jgi:subtilase family serine protease